MARISRDLDAKVRRQAKDRCGYCLSPQEFLPFKLEIEHFHPRALGGDTLEENLWLACRECNAHKARKTKASDSLTGKTTKLFNPRKQNWDRHFEFGGGGSEIIGKTACGRATVACLQMNNIYQTTARLAWSETGRFPPGF